MNHGCFFLLLGALVALSYSLKLEQATVLFRHGDRSPTHTYPKDPYQKSFWPQGFSQLSTEGMRQEYFLGEVLKSRYVDEMNLVHPNYTRVQVYTRSTDYDRTLMSAECVLAGLFPPKGNQVFNSTLLWQPIPVHTVPREDDDILLAFSNCPAYTKLRHEDTEKPSYINLEKENKEFFHSLEENTGLESVNLTNMHSLYDVLFVEEVKNLTLPDWVNDAVMEHMLNLTMYTSSLMFNTVTKNQLTAGNWIGKVMNDMETRKENSEDQMRLYLYSAHDSTVAAMMTALGVFNGKPPPYCATFIVELYSSSSSEYWVSLFYRNETYGSHLLPLHVESCLNKTLCTLQEFIELTDPLVPSDWDKECGLGSDKAGSSIPFSTTLAVLICLLVLVVVLLLVTVVTCVRSIRKDGRIYYSKLPNPKNT